MSLLIIFLVMARWTAWRTVPIAAALAVATQTAITLVREGAGVADLDLARFALFSAIAYGMALIYAAAALYIVRAWRWWWDPRRRT